jgi:hypothetical protein
VQELCPVPENLPAAQVVQELCPVPENLPAAQVVQELCPVPENWPAAQVPLSATVPVQNEPAGQAVQTQFNTYWPAGHEAGHFGGHIFIPELSWKHMLQPWFHATPGGESFIQLPLLK